MSDTPWDMAVRIVCRSKEADCTLTLASAVKRFMAMPEAERQLTEIHPEFPVDGLIILDWKSIVGLGDPPA